MSLKTIGLSVTLGAVTAGFDMAMGRSINKINAVGGTLEKLKNHKLKLVADDKNVDKYNQRLETIQKTIDHLKSKNNNIEVKIATAKSKEEAEKLKEELAKVNQKVRVLNSQKVKIKDKLEDAKEQAEKLNKSILKTNKLIDSINSKKIAIQANVDKRNDIKNSIMDKVALGATVALPFKFGIEFESSMARVRALANANDEEFKKLNDTAKKLGATTTFSASEVAQGMGFLSMAGFKANDTVDAMSGLLNLASAGQTDLATTSDIASNILSGFTLKASEMGRVADVMAKAMTSANVDTQMLGDTMKYVAPVASSVGASIEEVTALTAKLGDVGIQGSQAGTTFFRSHDFVGVYMRTCIQR